MTVLILPGEAGLTAVARGLLDAAADLGLPAAVVEWSPSKGGFNVPEKVAAAYAGCLHPPAEAQEDGTPAPAEDVVPPAAEVAEVEETAGPRRYSDAEKAAAVAAVKGGRSIASVAEEMGCSATSVSKWVAAAAAKTGEEGQ